jgi:hypothetical protein
MAVLPEREKNLVVAVPVDGKPRESSWGGAVAALGDTAFLSCLPGLCAMCMWCYLFAW